MNTIINKIDKARRPSSRAAAFGRVALVAAALCVATVPSPLFAEAKSATLKATGYSGSAITDGFQVLVKLSASNDAYGFSYTEAGGASHYIWFTSADGATVYPHEIDKWDTSGDSFVWVRLPELKKGTTFKMHWSDNASDVQSASGNVWDGFVGVWHMNETGKTAEPDSTGHGLNATPLDNNSGGVSFNAEAGIVGLGRANSYAMDGRYFSVGSNDNPYHSTITTKANFSVSGWWKLSNTPSGNGYQRLICGMSKDSLHSWDVWRQDDSKIGVRSGDGSNDNSSTGYGVAISTWDTWHYLTVAWEGNKAKVYKNGSFVAEQTLRDNTHPFNVFTIGGRVGVSNRSFVGSFDEVRMYNGVLSAERIAADYETMNKPTEFLTLDSQATATWTGAAGNGNPATAANWDYYASGSETPVAQVPDGETAVTIAGDNVNLQIPASSTFACKSFTIGTCTFTADCDWRGLSVKPTISGTADLAGHNLQLNDLAPGVGSSFANSSATASQVRLPVAIVNGAVTDEELANLSVASNVQIVMANSVNTTATANSQIGYVSGGTSSYVQTGGTFTSSGLALELGKKSGGTGLFRIEAGTAKITTIKAQSAAGANARIELDSGDLQAARLELGNSSSGSAIVNQTGGKFNAARLSGTSGGSNGDVLIGYSDNGTGVYNLTGGTLTTKGTGGGGLVLGYDTGAIGRMTVGGTGVVDLQGDGIIGRHGVGYLTITNGGTVTARQAFIVGGNRTGSVNANAIGTVTLTGGVLNVPGGNATYPEILVGRYKTGTLDIGGDGVVNASYGVLLGRETTGNGTLKLSGNGVLNTSKIVKGGGKAAAEFAGGKVVLTNVGAGSEASLLSGFDSLKIGDGGLAIDTAGHDASLEIPENFSRTDYASALVKDGAGTLTLNKLPDVASVAVNAGTLVVTNGSDNSASDAAANTLAHRWSFNDGFEDSVGNVTATQAGAMPVTLDNGQAVMQGGPANSNNFWGGLNLGTGVLGTGDATIEIWGTLETPPPGTQWAYLAAYGNDADAIFAWAWQAGNNWYDNAEIWYGGKKKKGANGIVYRNEAGLRRETKKEYHLAVTFTDNGDGTTNVRFSRRDTSTNPMTVVTYSFNNVAWSIAEGIESWALTIGHNPFSNRTYESNAKYNEVRVWHSALSDEALKASALYGPDATADQIAVLSDPASVRALNVASGAEVSLEGNTLTQPVVSGGGTISGGSLNVTKVLSPGGDGTAGTLTISGGAVTGEIRLDVGDKIVVDGGTLDLSGATVTLLDPENLVEAFTFVECVNGGSLAGTPVADETIQSPWKVLVSGSRVRITKAGTAIFLR